MAAQSALTENNTVADMRVVVSGWKDPLQNHFYKECACETFFCFTEALLSETEQTSDTGWQNSEAA